MNQEAPCGATFHAPVRELCVILFSCLLLLFRVARAGAEGERH